MVRTLNSLARAAAKLGAEIDFLSPDGFLDLPGADLSGPAAGVAEPARIAERIEAAKPGRHSYRDRGADRPRGAGLLPAPRPAVHDQLYDALSGIYLGALADPGELDL